jgi:menaquinone-dependent protoporphyrinogen oxidase
MRKEAFAMRGVLIVHASRHGGTRGIAERIGEVLRAREIDAVVSPAADQPIAGAFDAVVVGSGVYMGSWLKEGIEFLERNAEVLSARPTWLFSSGPLPGSSKEQPAEEDRYGGALGPADGPGSGGRKKIEALAERIGIREHRIFVGAYDPNDPPKALSERLARMLPAVKNILPEGDFRQWDLIDAWAEEIAQEVAGKVAVG